MRFFSCFTCCCCYYFITITLPSKNFSHLSTGFTKFYTHSTCFIFVIIIISKIASPFLVLITIILISKSCLVITHTLSSFLLITVLFCNTTKQKRVNYIVTLLENQHTTQQQYYILSFLPFYCDHFHQDDSLMVSAFQISILFLSQILNTIVKQAKNRKRGTYPPPPLHQHLSPSPSFNCEIESSQCPV